MGADEIRQGSHLFFRSIRHMRRDKERSVKLVDKPGSVTSEEATIIHLDPESLQGSSNLPVPNASHANGNLFGLAPSGVYHATNCYQTRGALLPHPFTLTCANKTSLRAIGGILSAALAVSLHCPGVTWHSALWSPDFPLLNR